MQLIDLMSSYIRNLKREQQLSPRSIILYESDLRLFSQYVGEFKPISEITHQVVERYLRKLIEVDRVTDTTLSRKLCAIRSFFRFLENEDFISRSPVTRLPIKISIKRKSPPVISSEEIKKFFRAIESERLRLQKLLIRCRHRGDREWLLVYQLLCNLRNTVLFSLVYETGIKLRDLLIIPSEYVELRRRSCVFHVQHNSLRGYVITNPETVKLIKQYQKLVSSCGCKSPYFFFNRNMGHLSLVMMQKNFKKYLKQAGINRKLTPTSLRHAYAVNLFKNNTNIPDIRETLGYKTFEGLLIYQDYFNTSMGNTRKKTQ